MATSERKRSSIFGKLSFFPTKSSAVWEVKSEEDLGLDVSPVKTAQNPERRRVKTLERPASKESNGPDASIDRRRTITGVEPLGGSQIGSQLSLGTGRSYGSAYSASTSRSHGSTYSAGSERPRPRTLEGIPPISPLALPSQPSVTSSERSSRRLSHIQLVPKSMLPADKLPVSTEELRRVERELQTLAAKERRSREFSGESDRPGSESDRPRSDTGSTGNGRVRIQFVPKSSLSSQSSEISEQPINLPPPKPILKERTRISRSLTAVTEETRINSSYHSDIEEEDEEDEEHALRDAK